MNSRQELLEEVIEETRKKAIALIQSKIDSAGCTPPADLAQFIVTEDFIRRFRELFKDVGGDTVL